MLIVMVIVWVSLMFAVCGMVLGYGSESFAGWGVLCVIIACIYSYYHPDLNPPHKRDNPAAHVGNCGNDGRDNHSNKAPDDAEADTGPEEKPDKAARRPEAGKKRVIPR